MKLLIIILIFIGITLIMISLVNRQLKCPPPMIQYRFIPQTLLDEQLSISDDPLNEKLHIFENNVISNGYNTYEI